MLPQDHWLHFLRARDLEQILSETPDRLEGPVLEIGCGDGFVTTLLRKRFNQVVPIDIKPRDYVNGLCVANAQKLPFADRSFGLVISFGVLEHIVDLTACLNELRRVTRDDAVMIHVMPTPVWKFMQIALFPQYLIMFSLVPKLTGKRRKIQPVGNLWDSCLEAGRKDGIKKKQVKFYGLLPFVHGSAASHWEEFCRFSKRAWLKFFAEHGFNVFRTSPLYLHSAYRLYPYKGIGIREFISRRGLCSNFAYWIRKDYFGED